MEIFLGLAIVAVALVALNFGLQRFARPDKGSKRIAGCCGMALPEELMRGEGAAGAANTAGAANGPGRPQTKIRTNISSEDPGEDRREDYHEL